MSTKYELTLTPTTYSINLKKESQVLNVVPVEYDVSVKTLDYNLSMDKNELKVSLSRTGGQGSKGDSISRAFINELNELIIVSVNILGEEKEINSGAIENVVDINSLSDVTLNNIENNQVLVYNSATEQWENKPHTFATTSDLGDIDNTNKTDGSLLVYSSNSSKYEATNTLQNQNTIILGGSF